MVWQRHPDHCRDIKSYGMWVTKPVRTYNVFVQLLAHTYSTPFSTKIKVGVFYL